MASKVLKSFLIGIGWDTKGLEAGDKKIQGSLQGVKSSALGMSAALIGAFGVGAAIIVSTSNKIDQLASATQNMRTPVNTVYNFGNAVELMGGQASEAYDALKRLEEFQNNFRLNGNDGALDPLAKAGMDVGALTRTVKYGDGMDLYRELERQYKERKPDEGQRAQVQSTLGFSNGTARFLNRGGADEKMAQAASNTGSIDQMTESARRFAESNTALGQKFEGMSNELSEKFMPRLIGASEWMGKFLDEHREEISKVIGYAAEEPASAALGASTGAVIGGSILSFLGMKGLGTAASKTGMTGLIASGSYMATDSIFDKLESHEGYRKFSDSIDNGARDIGLGWAVDLSNLAFNKEAQSKVSSSPSVSTPPEAIYGERSAADSLPPESSYSRKEDIQANAEALGGVLSRSPIKVNNQLGVTLQIDGQTLDNRIIQVNERQNYEADGDLRSTTRR
ncbi:hypothetical protein ACI77I_11760 [Pseudomonas sp. D47]|uniref:hypothetical protein n=1 Tax=Pseudomonas sp. D47 TaxID=3159447 RepID=UPI00387ADC6E